MPSQPRGAGVLEDDRSVARAVLVEGDAFMGMTEKLLQEALALLDWRAPQVLAIEFEEVERAEHGGGIMTVPSDQVENGKSAFVADDGLAIEQAGAHREHGHCRDDLGKSVREVCALFWSAIGHGRRCAGP